MDFNRLKKIYGLASQISFRDIYPLIRAAKRKKFHRGEILLEEGQNSNDLYFILKGILRVYAVLENGEEITVDLKAENEIYGCHDYILFDRPSQCYVQALEDTSAYLIDYSRVLQVFEKNGNLNTIHSQGLKFLLKSSFNRIGSFLVMNPENRYLDFLENRPNLANRIADRHIANYLGITPVSLSRIKKRIYLKRKD